MAEALRTLLKAVGGALVGLGVLGLVEGGLRLAGLPEPGLYAGDPAWAWTLRPGLDLEVPGPEGDFPLRTDARGLRGPAPPAAGPWTLALGCSTTFGWGLAAEAAWPARLGEALGEVVVNAGQPGWSTEQARRALPELLAGLGASPPRRIVAAWIVRDAWPAPRPDRAATPTPWWLQTHLARLLRGGLGPARAGQAQSGAALARPDPAAWPTTRVPPDRYAENIVEIEAILASWAPGAEVIWLAFPQPEPLPEWEAVLAARGSALLPRLPPSAFFEGDPVHLDADGHGALAAWLADQPALSGRAPAPAP